jgi:hypothetical protein
MPTNRVPIKPRLQEQLSDEALSAFAAILEATSEDEWWSNHEVLWHEVRARLHEFPCVRDPDMESPWPMGSPGAAQWKRAQSFWLRLEDALSERD